MKTEKHTIKIYDYKDCIDCFGNKNKEDRYIISDGTGVDAVGENFTKEEAKKICLELNTDRFCCDNCGGDFTQEEMDFDVNDRDLCKNCNHQSYNDAPYGQRE